MRLARFALVGLVGALVNEGLLFIFTEYLGVFYLVSSVIAIEVSIFHNFVFHELWTFKDRKKRWNPFVRYLLYHSLSLMGMGINLLILAVFTTFFGIHYLISNAVAIFIVFAWNFLTNNRLTWMFEVAKLPPINQKPLVSIVIPTYNERENIAELFDRIHTSLSKSKINYEIIVVDDDSPDGTWRVAKNLGKKYKAKVIRRTDERGLSSAVFRGFKEAKGNILGIMDADLSHPPERIPEMVKSITNGSADIVVGSRYVRGGGIKDWSFTRRIVSKAAVILAKPLTNLKDPVSGFLFFRKDAVDIDSLVPEGFKIGLEITVKSKGIVKEVPYVFTGRRKGKSKLGFKEIISYIKQLVRLYLYKLNT